MKSIEDLPVLCGAEHIQALTGCSKPQSYLFIREAGGANLSPRIVRVSRERLLDWLKEKGLL